MKKFNLLFIFSFILNHGWSQNQINNSNKNGTLAAGQNCIQVKGVSKISSISVGLSGTLDDADYFGQNVKNFGDFDGDGVEDLIVGSQLDDDGGTNLGAVYIILLKSDGTIKSKQKISALEGGFTGTLTSANYFGSAVSKLKDVDGDGVNDLLVGQLYDNTVTTRSGAVWIIFLNSNGTVKSHQKIANGIGGFPIILGDDDNFGCDASETGDLDGDGITDIVVGAPYDDDGGVNKGAVYIIYLNSNGTAKSYKKISSTTGGFNGILANDDNFGYSVSGNADLNNDGKKDIVVGARAADDGGPDRGAAWILFLNISQNVMGQNKISSTSGSFTGTLDDGDYFGNGVAIVGDLNNDSYMDIAVSAPYDDDGGTDKGAAWLLMLDNTGKVKDQIKISATSQMILNNKLDDGDLLGFRISALNDIDGNGQKEIVIGAMKDDDGGTDRGAVYIMNLEDTCSTSSIISPLSANNFDFKIYPNPANNFLNIEYPDAISSLCKLKIINMLGEVLIEINLKEKTSFQSMYLIDISVLKPGIYHIQMSTENMSHYDKIIINR